jgi:hypothetical protein
MLQIMTQLTGSQRSIVVRSDRMLHQYPHHSEAACKQRQDATSDVPLAFYYIDLLMRISEGVLYGNEVVALNSGDSSDDISTAEPQVATTRFVRFPDACMYW